MATKKVVEKEEVAEEKQEGVKQNLTPKAMVMKKHLDKQDKVEIFIPRVKGEKKGEIETVILNGYRFNIERGVRVKVPAQVAEVWYDSIADTEEAVATAQEKAGSVEGK